MIVDVIVSWDAEVIDITSLLGFESRILVTLLTQVVYTSGVEVRARRDEQRRKYSKMDKGTKDTLVRSRRENGEG